MSHLFTQNSTNINQIFFWSYKRNGTSMMNPITGISMNKVLQGCFRKNVIYKYKSLHNINRFMNNKQTNECFFFVTAAVILRCMSNNKENKHT